MATIITNCPECGCGLAFGTGLFGKKKVKCSCGRVVTIEEAQALNEQSARYEKEAEASRRLEPAPVRLPADPNDYTTRLDEQSLRELEGTADELYFLNPTDSRSEQELHAEFEGYFAKPMFAGYYVMKNVSPEYFDENPACKPVNFLFLRGDEPVLAVNIVPYTGISHGAIKNVRLACEDKGINYIHFIIGYPNKEHYVVRRVLEELGEIRRLY